MANLSVSVYDEHNIINEASFIVKDGLPIKIKTTNIEAWSPSNPKLYDIKLTINNIDGDKAIDEDEAEKIPSSKNNDIPSEETVVQNNINNQRLGQLFGL